jgi:hypothetical protein
LSLDELFDGVSKNLEIDFEKKAKMLGHPGEVGTGRENVLKSILTKYIPKRYVVESGFVIDALGNRSEQIDIIIYEANYTPVFEIVKEKKFFPCETVVAVGQVKTNINSRKKMQECLNNIKSVKELDRSNKGTNLMITGPGISLLPLASHFDHNKNFRDQIFGFIFCSSSIKSDLMVDELNKFNTENDQRFWTNLIVNYNQFLIEYMERVEDKDLLSQDPMKAQGISLTDRSLNPHIFAYFVSILNNFLNQAHIARPNLYSYCNLSTVRHYNIPLLAKQETKET